MIYFFVVKGLSVSDGLFRLPSFIESEPNLTLGCLSLYNVYTIQKNIFANMFNIHSVSYINSINELMLKKWF